MKNLYNYLTIILDGTTRYDFDEMRVHVIYVNKNYRDTVIRHLDESGYHYEKPVGGYDGAIVRSAIEKRDIHILFTEE